MVLNLLDLGSGFMNFVMRPLGGYFGDVLYRSFGSKGKKIWMLSCGLAMGISLIAGGFYLQQNSSVQRVCCRILDSRITNTVRFFSANSHRHLLYFGHLFRTWKWRQLCSGPPL